MGFVVRVLRKGHRWALIAIISVALFLSIWASASSNASASVDEWSMFRHDQAHSGYATDGPTGFVKLLWNFTTGAPVWSSPAVVNGSVFVGSRDGNVYCFDAANGSYLWSYQTGDVIEFSSPAVVDGSVYIGSDNCKVYSLNESTGMPNWIYLTGGAIRSSPAVVDGYVYIGSWDFNVYCLNASTGDKVWSFSTYGTVDSSPAVVDGVVYVGSTDDNLYALNASTGMKLWSDHLGSIGSSPAVYNGLVYIGSNDGAIYAFNCSTGAQIWRYQTQDAVVSSPAVANGYVYVGSEDDNLYCLSASTGDKIWASPTGYWVWSSPSVANGFVYVGSEDCNIYCFNATTGATLWVYATGDPVDSSPAVAYGNLYVGSEDCRVYALTGSSVPIASSVVPNTLPMNVIAFDVFVSVVIALIAAAVILQVRSNTQSRRDLKTEDKEGGIRAWVAVHSDAVCIGLILGFSAIFFINLGSGPLWAADEQTYSQWAFHMLKTGDFLSPWAFGGLATWMGKPPLYTALMALSYQIFGVNNFGARFWSAVFGLLSCVMIFFLGKKVYNRYIGLMSAIVLGTFTTFFAFARHAMMDVPLVFFMLASVYFLLLSEKGKRSNWFAALSGVFFGLALLTKQLEALLIPMITLFYFLLTQRNFRFLFTKRFTLSWGVGLLIFAPWLALMNNAFGWSFWNWFFVYHDVARSLMPIEGHVGGYLFYFNYLINSENVLWLAILPFATALCIFKSVFRRVKADILVLEWMIVVFAVFTVAQTKLYWYIIPVFPAFALAISSFLFQVFTKIMIFDRKHANRGKPEPAKA
jgi:outer membrane protein assembly factor BamB